MNCDKSRSQLLIVNCFSTITNSHVKAKHFLFIAAAILAVAFAPQPTQARIVKIYTFNGPNSKTPKPPTDSVSGYPNLKIGNVTWASVNVDDYQTFAAKPDMYTKFYQFNRPMAYSATDPLMPSWTVTSIVEDTDWHPDSSPCPAGWQLPTVKEYQALNGAGSTWAAAYDAKRGNAVAGRFYGPNHTSCSLPSKMSGCIFFSASGNRNRSDGTLNTQGDNGYGWSSMQSGENQGYNLNYNIVSNPSNTSNKAFGFPVRCVRTN